ncbi:MAG: hypothetical protein WDW38_011079 [Sanguina aurantia]
MVARVRRRGCYQRPDEPSLARMTRSSRGSLDSTEARPKPPYVLSRLSSRSIVLVPLVRRHLTVPAHNCAIASAMVARVRRRGCYQRPDEPSLARMTRSSRGSLDSTEARPKPPYVLSRLSSRSIVLVPLVRRHLTVPAHNCAIASAMVARVRRRGCYQRPDEPSLARMTRSSRGSLDSTEARPKPPYVLSRLSSRSIVLVPLVRRHLTVPAHNCAIASAMVARVRRRGCYQRPDEPSLARMTRSSRGSLDSTEARPKPPYVLSRLSSRSIVLVPLVRRHLTVPAHNCAIASAMVARVRRRGCYQRPDEPSLARMTRSSRGSLDSTEARPKPPYVLSRLSSRSIVLVPLVRRHLTVPAHNCAIASAMVARVRRRGCYQRPSCSPGGFVGGPGCDVSLAAWTSRRHLRPALWCSVRSGRVSLSLHTWSHWSSRWQDEPSLARMTRSSRGSLDSTEARPKPPYVLSRLSSRSIVLVPLVRRHLTVPAHNCAIASAMVARVRRRGCYQRPLLQGLVRTGSERGRRPALRSAGRAEAAPGWQDEPSLARMTRSSRGSLDSTEARPKPPYVLSRLSSRSIVLVPLVRRHLTVPAHNCAIASAMVARVRRRGCYQRPDEPSLARMTRSSRGSLDSTEARPKPPYVLSRLSSRSIVLVPLVRRHLTVPAHNCAIASAMVARVRRRGCYQRPDEPSLARMTRSSRGSLDSTEARPKPPYVLSRLSSRSIVLVPLVRRHLTVPAHNCAIASAMVARVRRRGCYQRPDEPSLARMTRSSRGSLDSTEARPKPPYVLSRLSSRSIVLVPLVRRHLTVPAHNCAIASAMVARVRRRGCYQRPDEPSLARMTRSSRGSLDSTEARPKPPYVLSRLSSRSIVLVPLVRRHLTVPAHNCAIASAMVARVRRRGCYQRPLLQGLVRTGSERGRRPASPLDAPRPLPAAPRPGSHRERASEVGAGVSAGRAEAAPGRWQDEPSLARMTRSSRGSLDSTEARPKPPYVLSRLSSRSIVLVPLVRRHLTVPAHNCAIASAMVARVRRRGCYQRPDEPSLARMTRSSRGSLDSTEARPKPPYVLSRLSSRSIVLVPLVRRHLTVPAHNCAIASAMVARVRRRGCYQRPDEPSLARMTRSSRGSLDSTEARPKPPYVLSRLSSRSIVLVPLVRRHLTVPAHNCAIASAMVARVRRRGCYQRPDEPSLARMTRSSRGSLDSTEARPKPPYVLSRLSSRSIVLVPLVRRHLTVPAHNCAIASAMVARVRRRGCYQRPLLQGLVRTGSERGRRPASPLDAPRPLPGRSLA